MFVEVVVLIISAGSREMLVWIANSKGPDQTASLEAVWSGSELFMHS